jgi:hypothetical protein
MISNGAAWRRRSRTLNGNIELLLPDDFSMDVDIVVTERNSGNAPQIYHLSDFNLWLIPSLGATITK